MSAINIVIRAINSTKAAFQQVGKQAEDLNRRMRRIAGVMRGLFAAGIIATFVRKLFQAGTETDAVRKATERLKGSWESVISTIGDGLQKAFIAIEPLLSRIGKAWDDWLKKVTEAFMAWGAFSAGQTMGEAVGSASGLVEDEYAARAARREAIKKAAEEKAQQNELEKARQEYEQKARKALEDRLALAGKLHLKEMELAEATEELRSATAQNDEAAYYRARSRILDIEKEIAEIQEEQHEAEQDAAKERKEEGKAILDAEKKRQEEAADAEKERKKEAADAEKERLEAAKDRIEKSLRAELDAIAKAADAAREEEAKKREEADRLRAESIGGPGARRERRREERDREKQEERAAKVIAEARRRAARGNRRLAPQFREALRADRAAREAVRAGARAAELEKRAQEAQVKAASHLESIDKQISDLNKIKA